MTDTQLDYEFYTMAGFIAAEAHAVELVKAHPTDANIAQMDWVRRERLAHIECHNTAIDRFLDALSAERAAARV